MQSPCGPNDLDDICGIALVHHGEALVQSDGRTMPPQDAEAERVEGASRHIPAAPVEQRRGSVEHLCSRTSCKRQENDPLGGDTALHEEGHPVNQGSRLPGPGTCYDETRSGAGRHDRMLLPVQRGLIVERQVCFARILLML
jgi:hypothetical protein